MSFMDDPALVARAAARDADALMLLAVRRLRGEGGPRDLPEARRWLRRAVEVGHVDGALMEVALTANGSGGPADWPAARRLLESAARSDFVARAQLDLIDAMQLDLAGQTTKQYRLEHLSGVLPLIRIGHFLTPAECTHLATVAADLLQPAAVIDPVTGRTTLNPIRDSHDGAIGPAKEDLAIRAINHRIAGLSETNVTQGEPLTVLRYSPGQQFRLHTDIIAGAANQRIRTILIYLNDGYTGGETDFPDISVRVQGRAGDAVMFDNVDAAGRPLANARHAGLPVRSGVKWLATRWIRAQPIDPWNMP